MEEVINQLVLKSKAYKDIHSFSPRPGIYAFFYYGSAFPLKSAGHIKKGDLIYIGKTESSQISRDQKTHFTSGKTGSSTVRRSLGAILKDELNLKPIPRNATDYNRGRYHHYKFDNESEEKLTNWMVNNLGLSFYEYPASKAELEQLESALINKLCPILNLSKNSANRFGAEISALRKRCAEEARGVKDTEIKPYKDQKAKTSSIMKSKYGSQSNPENKYKLHEAMEQVLKNCPNRTATADFISEEIWKKGLYKKNDGGRALPGQIKLRAKNYSQFKINGNLIKFT